MSQASHSTRRSVRSTSTLSSLLSNKSLELVFGLIDDYYHSVQGESQPSTADLLGNLGPSAGRASRLGPSTNSAGSPSRAGRAGSSSSSSTDPTGRGLDTLVAAADEQEPPQGPPSTTDAVVRRAMLAAQSDGRRLEELLNVLSAAQRHASTSAASRDQIQVGPQRSHQALCATPHAPISNPSRPSAKRSRRSRGIAPNPFPHTPPPAHAGPSHHQGVLSAAPPRHLTPRRGACACLWIGSCAPLPHSSWLAHAHGVRSSPLTTAHDRSRPCAHRDRRAGSGCTRR